MFERVLKICCDFYALPPGEVFKGHGKRTRHDLSWVRYVVMFLCREGGVPVKVLARELGCSHSLSSRAVQAVRDRMDVCEDFRADVDRLRNAIGVDDEKPRRVS